MMDLAAYCFLLGAALLALAILSAPLQDIRPNRSTPALRALDDFREWVGVVCLLVGGSMLMLSALLFCVGAIEAVF